MSRIPENEIECIKKEVDLVALVQSKGIELKKHGSKDLVGLSPFTKEKTPSFIITPAKNLWHCMSSGKGGSVIDFIMHYEGISFRHAFEVLAEGSVTKVMHSSRPTSQCTVPKLPCPLDLDVDDHTLINQVIDYYHQRLKQSKAALNYLHKRGLTEQTIDAFKIGFADRTLGLRLPDKNRKEGAKIREGLQRLGVYRSSGHEHFSGSVIFPLTNEEGKVTEIYGRKINDNLRAGTAYHLYLPGPHKGLLNWKAFESKEIILTESVIDALTFWSHGIKNVTCIYGAEGFTQDLEEAFKKHHTQKVYLAYDRDEAGERAAMRDAKRLGDLGLECFRVNFPHGMDANQYATKVTPASKSLELLVNQAEWIERKCGSTKSLPSTSSLSLAAKLAANKGQALDPQTDASHPQNQFSAAKEEKLQTNPDLEIKILNANEVELSLGDRSYRVRGLEKNTSYDVLKINLRLMVNDLFYIDTLDLYQAKQRRVFIEAAAAETNLQTELIKRDLGKILLKLEEHQENKLQEDLEPQEVQIELSAEEKQEALELLKDPRLLDKVVEAFDACGIVGENINKLTGYLAAVSRKLDKPLAIIIQSTSAAGKTSLMEAVLQMMPEEERIKYSAMTGQSLYYLGETNLKNKILAIVEEEGAEKASYALKLLQSEGELTIASTGKDDNGRMKTEEYHVEGPVMIFLTTTAIDIDEELLNRCIVLSVDESREQTQKIHDLQRQAETLEGLETKIKKKQVLRTHQNAQRLLKALHVVNPYAPKLTFLSDRTRTRRDHMKYLTLIRTIALLHQYQRPLKEKDGVSYIEVIPEDINRADEIVKNVFASSFDELPPQTRKLFEAIKNYVAVRAQKEACELSEVLFSRRDIREALGWGNTQLKIHLKRLEDMEHLSIKLNPIHRQQFLYSLVSKPYAAQKADRSGTGRGSGPTGLSVDNQHVNGTGRYKLQIAQEA